MQAVNLLPLENRPAGRWTALGTGLAPERVIPIGAAVTAVIALALAGFYVRERSVVHSKQNTLAQQQARLVAVNAQAQVVRDAQAQSGAMTTVVDSIVAGRMIWDSTLGDLARVLPDGVSLTALQAAAPVADVPVAPTTTDTTATTTTTTTTTPVAPVAPVAPTTNFTITGNAPSHVRVALILDRLALLPWLSNIALQTTNRLATGSVQFTVVASVLSNGGH
jgi:Tfp pilus assembly protein PilN